MEPVDGSDIPLFWVSQTVMETWWWPSPRVWRFVRQLNLNMLCFYSLHCFLPWAFEEFFLWHILSHETPSLPAWCKCGTKLWIILDYVPTFLRCSSGTVQPLFCCLMIFRTGGVPCIEPRKRRKIWSAPRRCSPECEGRPSTHFAVAKKCQAAPILCGSVFLNLRGHSVGSGLYG